MMAFVGKAYRGGVKIVVGSHSWVPYAKKEWAFQHEMELLAACGMPNSAILEAATIKNARFFRIEDRLGSIEKGKIADLLLLKGNPIDDLAAMYHVKRVMLNGVWEE